MEKCNKCDKEMENLGNISGIIYTSDPVQWDDVYVCDDCKIKRTIRKHGYGNITLCGGRALDDYESDMPTQKGATIDFSNCDSPCNTIIR